MSAQENRSSQPQLTVPRARRTPASALFWRLFAINGLVFAAGLTVLAMSPATVSAPVLVTELPVLAVGLALILAANAVLIRTSLAPLDGLTTLMERVDLVHPGDRFPTTGNGDLTNLVGTFNTMLDRLEAERGASTAQILAAQETERKRIAQELHDEIGQSLTAVLLGMKRAVDRAPADLQEELHGVQETVRTSLDEVRQVARRLRPGTLEDLGLLSALSALAADFTDASGVPVSRAFDSELPTLSPEVELVVYRIAQEGLTNVARHADATRVRISLTTRTGAVELRIADDGRGEIAGEGTGIHGMRERALLIGAHLDIDAEPALGTVVTLVVPTAAKEQAS